MNTDGRDSHCGDADAAWPLVASESPAPAIATDVSTPAILIPEPCRADHARAIATVAISSDGPKLVETALGHGAAVSKAASGRSCRSRPCRPSDATAPTRPVPSAP